MELLLTKMERLQIELDLGEWLRSRIQFRYILFERWISHLNGNVE